ncbi:unnamed protein product [Closterium sp. Yama58-4]|nr:unnamed protein product [Closterium sp. Yama58-4]
MACTSRGFSEDVFSLSLVPKRGKLLAPSEEERARRAVSVHEAKRSIDGPPAAHCFSSRHVDHGQRDYGWKPGDSHWTGGLREGLAEARRGPCLEATCPLTPPRRANDAFCDPPAATGRTAAAQRGQRAQCGKCDGDSDGWRSRSAECGAASAAADEAATAVWSLNCQRHRRGCTTARRKMDPTSSSMQRIRECDGAGCASRDTGGARMRGGRARGGGDGGGDCCVSRARGRLRAAAQSAKAEGKDPRQAWRGRARGGAGAWLISPLRWPSLLNLPLLLLRLLLLGCVLASPVVTSLGGPSPVRINCGGSEHITSSDGRVWEPDAFFTGGEAAAVLNASQLGFPKEVAAQRIFHTGDVSCYDIPIPPGRFIVRLAFAYNSDTPPAKTFETVSSVTVQGGRTSSAQDFSVSATSALTGAAAPRDGSLMASAVGAAHLAAPAAAPAASAAVVSRLPDDTPFSTASGKGPLGGFDSQGMGDLPPSDTELGGGLQEHVQARWPRFAVLVEGVQMETVSMGGHVGAVYEAEYIVDSADASLTLCFLPVWGHALVNSIEILPVPPPFYLLPQVVPPNAFLAVRARIDCGRAATNDSAVAGSNGTAEGSTNRLASNYGALPATTGTNSTWSFDTLVATSGFGPSGQGTTMQDALGRRWSSDLNQIVQTQQVGVPAPSGEAGQGAMGRGQQEQVQAQWRVKPPKSVQTFVPVSGAGEAPLFLAQPLLQTAREAVLASGLHYSFSIRVPARLNRWMVLLHFVAVQPGSRVGERVFDIHMNGVTVSAFDILRETHGQQNRLVTLPVVVGFSRPAIGSAPTLEVQLVACNGSKLSPLITSIEVIEVVRANVPRENVVSELKAQQSGDPKSAFPSASSHSRSYAAVVAGAIGGAGALVLLVMLVPLVLLWRRQHRRRRAAMRTHLLGLNAVDSAAAPQTDDVEGISHNEELGLVEVIEETR